MASIPHFYSDYTIYPIPSDFSELPPGATSSVGGGSRGAAGALWGEETLVPLFDEFGLDQTVSPSEYSEALSSAVTAAVDPSSYPQQQQQQQEVPDAGALALPELNMGMCSIAAGCQNFCVGYQPDQLYEYGDDCFGLVPEMKPVYNPVASDNWEIQSNQVPAAEDSNMKVGRYSEEVRKERILRYLKKRNQRNFNKTIKYACRKTLADRRIRVRGRFARNNEACDQEVNPTKNDTSIHKDAALLYNHDVGVQMKKDEEEWLQEITSLIYLPYISS